MTWGALVVRALRPRRVILLSLFDATVWIGALAAFAALHAGPVSGAVDWPGVVRLGLAAGALQVLVGWAVRLHHGRAVLGTFDELLLLTAVTAAVGVLLPVVDAAILRTAVPAGVAVTAGFPALVVAGLGRAAWRAFRERVRECGPTADSTPVLVFGAGEGGRQLVDSMFRDAGRVWRPVGLLDDDPLKRHRRFHGVPVLGTRQDLRRAVERTGATTLVVAVPSATRSLIRSLGYDAVDLGLDLKVVPGVGDLLGGRVGVADIRDLDVADLLGRHQVDTDVASIAGYLTGARVLVTGAGGSIGSELCRQIAGFAPAELIMLDRDESALHAVQLSIYGTASLDNPDVVLADIRDARRLHEVFTLRRPDVVFHAAALKHLTMLEQYPAEAVKSNVWGTLTVLEAARASGVGTFVNVSTDKAANPCSVLGYTKRIAERLTAEVAGTARGTYLSVRFGNVLGSRGSVLTTFAAQIAAGGPITVTDPQVTRYFMTVQEAVQLVIQAGAIGSSGDALVLDMGEPVRIQDVAQRLADESSRPIEIVYTGLHAGEKLHEELFGAGEHDVRPVHPLISHVSVPTLSREAALELDLHRTRPDVVAALRDLCVASPALAAARPPALVSTAKSREAA